ncbi:sensor histidine kinase [Streptomyces griseorubiginosus]|uniref:histidine kinase n=1 Tax=Streptomyces griseorubiginosus TaxID=67304 RepID=A0A124GU15_9ACTN|nr:MULTISPECIES: sensor histidine kinase [Streptomyces]AYC39527.1 Nitrate/nitrite sensor protein NarX [Streptomyces griseorubiginosus]KUM67323.1 histidine kinase [Streptomyces griseorubiginosus]KUN62466.1 histidine kinase [Streptomyces griseorubiginosus]TCR11538.1 signal transduction histidine kinase [Streptomyces sp. BK205]
MQRLYDFLRRHPTGVDVLWAVVLFGIALASETAGGESQGTGSPLAIIPVVLLLCLVIALRRRMPEKMLLLAIGLGVAQLVLDVETTAADFAFLVIVYTVAATASRWASRLALTMGLCAAPLAQLRWPEEHSSTLGNVAIVIFQTVPFALAWVLGDSIRTRRAYFAQLEERNARLEKEREAQAKVAVAAERARIARELHDVVAHNVSVMVVQADGAAYVLDAAPDQAKKALETISSTGRQALAEMRRLLGVLRTGEHQEGGEYVPQPDVEQIEDLVEQCRGSGLPVDFKIEGTPRPLPSGVELTAYRIVQEALTNTRKHGGPHAGASVRLVYFDDGLGLLVEDDGKGAPHELYEEGGADGAGHGLIGMRERVGMVGGTLDAGPRPGGGFRISALLPLKPAH